MKTQRSFGRGVYYMVLSAFWFAITYLFVKLCSGKTPFFLFTFVRFFIPFLIMLVVIFCQKQLRACFRVKGFHTHLLRAIFVVIAQFSIFYYISQNSLLNATLLLNTGPLFIPIIEWLVMGHRIGRSTIVSSVIAFTGVILILQPGTDLFSLLSFVGLLAGLGQACSQVIYGMHAREETVEVNLLILYFLTTCLSFIPLAIFSFKVEHYLQFDISITLLLFILILSVANVLNQFYRGQAYSKGGKPATLSTFLYLSILFAAILDWAIFGLEPNLYSILGGILIIGSGILKVTMRHYLLKKKG